ncbi:PAS domain-containing sensor histidine kinase [Pyxidicoccus fallax]|uniref:histidine kinase n=1 Tax=Pyxidicoccus fallax TaxID=394095 RepID=A0A848LHQ4_9BACT|nr:PAS domain-containing sensor histidine kinase [Pyxidicoccus fallax]NMO17041.1 PAS domain-containing protein [Pyxidicoccus fallax]NPC83334.1 PAS domain-containing sensor histidine kinase [Pyxidicoccus fallax]
MTSHPLLPPDQYRALVEHHPTMIWRAGLDAKCDYFNETWLSFTGRTLEQEMGNGWAEGVHPDDFDRCLKIFLDGFGRRQPFEMEYRLRRHDGVYRYIFDRGVPFWDDSGAFAGFIGSCVDVHERREADRMKTTFLSLIAHELRTPITSMNAFLEAARRKVARGESMDESLLNRLKAQSDKFAELVRELGDAARLEEGVALSIRRDEVDLEALVREHVARLGQDLSSRVRTRAAHAFDVKVEGGPFRVQGDRQRLEQVLGNLLHNALKYSPSGGTVQVALSREDSVYRLSVSDPGIGIPAEELPCVTRRYFRASNASPANYPGLGLGLALSREIAEQHGGALRVASQLGRGTTVTLEFPASTEGAK